MIAVNVKNLSIKYKDFLAVDNISFSVKKGEIFGIIGPNGAGKTSTLECIEGFRKIHSGEINVLGVTPDNRGSLFEKIGVQLQETKLQDNLKVIELIRLYASFYKKNADYEYLLKLFEIDTHRDFYVKKLSGGQKQKLSIILALIGEPDILFLDEISTGLDPKARVQIWETIEKLRASGKTIIISTHFMKEAERLCDRVMLMTEGKIKAIGTISELTETAQTKITLVLKTEDADSLIKNAPAGLDAKNIDGCVVIKVEDAGQIAPLISHFSSKTKITDIDVIKPQLEDIFLKLTGSKISNGYEEKTSTGVKE